MFEDLAGEQREFREKILDFFKRPSNPKNMKVLGIMFLIGMSFIAGSVLISGSLFHSTELNPGYGVPGSYQDPATQLWVENFAGSPFNTVNVANCASCGGSGFPGIILTSNTTSMAVAQEKVALPDYSQVIGKEMAIRVEHTYDNVGNCCSFDFGWFITTNSTLTTSGSFTPYNDRNVIAFMQVHGVGGGNAQWTLFLQKKTGDTIVSEDTGACSPSSSCFLQGTASLNLGVGSTAYDMAYALNFTGNSGQAGSSGNSQITVGNEFSPATPTTLNVPGMNLNPGQAYFGFWMGKKSNGADTSAIDFITVSRSIFSTTILSPGIYVFTPTVGTSPPPPPAPTIDPGGFFGPLIRSIIGLGVFIAQNIIAFLGFLASIIWPTLVTVFTQLANALKIVLNALGNFFGLGNIGDMIISFFTGVTNFLSNIVTSAFGQILNLVNLLVQFLTWLASLFGGPIWTGIIGIATLLAGGWATIITAYGFLTQLSTNGLLGINYYFLVDWIFGMFMLSTKGMDGFKTWVDLNGLVFQKIAMAMFFFVKESVQALVWIKQIVVNWV